LATTRLLGDLGYVTLRFDMRGIPLSRAVRDALARVAERLGVPMLAT